MIALGGPTLKLFSRSSSSFLLCLNDSTGRAYTETDWKSFAKLSTGKSQ